MSTTCLECGNAATYDSGMTQECATDPSCVNYVVAAQAEEAETIGDWAARTLKKIYTTDLTLPNGMILRPVPDGVILHLDPMGDRTYTGWWRWPPGQRAVWITNSTCHLPTQIQSCAAFDEKSREAYAYYAHWGPEKSPSSTDAIGIYVISESGYDHTQRIICGRVPQPKPTP